MAGGARRVDDGRGRIPRKTRTDAVEGQTADLGEVTLEGVREPGQGDGVVLTEAAPKPIAAGEKGVKG